MAKLFIGYVRNLKPVWSKAEGSDRATRKRSRLAHKRRDAA